MRWSARMCETNFDWELWYAWVPVTVYTDGKYIKVWREYVERKPDIGSGGSYEYRLPKG